MPRRDDALTPEAERELEALDRALADEPVGDEGLADLTLLVESVRHDAPRMRPEFVARLEQDIDTGFAREPRRGLGGLRLPRLPRLQLLAPAAGVMAAALIALVVVLGSGGGTDDSLDQRSAAPALSEAAPDADSGAAATPASPGALPDQSSDFEGEPPRVSKQEGAPSVRRLEAAPPAGTAAPDIGVAPEPPVGIPDQRLAPNARERKVERNADLTLRAKPGDLQSVSDDVVRTTDRFKGIVVSSSIASGEGGGESTFDLRVPTDKLDDALSAYSKLGDVVERRQGLSDITGSFVSAQDRLSDARAERRGLLRALGRASTRQQLDSLRARLRSVRGQIARRNGELNALRRRADLATVSLTVRSDPAATSEDDDGGAWSAGDALDDAGRVLEVAAGVAIIALAIMVPLALLGVPALLTARSARRRRRETALDTP